MKNKRHWAAHIVLAAAFILAVCAAFGVGAAVDRHVIQGASAVRPGLSVVPGSPVSPGMGGASNVGGLAAGEGSGFEWCAQYGGYQLGARYKGVYACGPAVGESTAFDSVGFQCVELSVRFIWADFGRYVSGIPSGGQLVQIAHNETGIPIGRPGVKSIPLPGDVLSLSGPNADQFGHTAVVVADHVNAAGTGNVEIMEQNGSSSGYDYLNVSHWVESYGDPSFDGGLYYYPDVSWLKLVHVHRKPIKHHFPINRRLTGRWIPMWVHWHIDVHFAHFVHRRHH